MNQQRRLAVPSAVFCVATTLLLASCKETSHSGDDDAVPAARKTLTASFYAASVAEIQQTSDFYLQIWNQNFTAHYDDLPKTGEIPEEKKPMTGSFYPQRDHGTNKVMIGGQSALQKYDNAFYNGVNTAAAWEESNHTSNISWAGHCNGFAASGQRHPREPKKNVVRGNVTFAPQDIKALMAELYMNADFQFLGGVRGCITPKEQIKGPGSRDDPTIMDVCQGMNPGTMHAALANWVGRMQHSIIMDIYAGDQVWNHPVVKYTVLSADAMTAQQAAMAVSNQGIYKFNPNAVKFVNVHANVFTVNTTSSEVLATRDISTNDLTYILELNANGDIIGGEWTGNSVTAHPNFIWLAFEPKPSNGDPSLGNPKLDPASVLSLWSDSVEDPNNPPPDFERPVTANSWGQFAGFTATFDGFNTGASFDGKPLQLRVKRGAAIAGAGIELDLNLNGALLTTVNSTANENFTIPVAANSGMNRFEFIWKKSGAVVYDEFLRFRVSR